MDRNILMARRQEFAHLRDTMQSMTITTELINIKLHLKTLETIAELFLEKYYRSMHTEMRVFYRQPTKAFISLNKSIKVRLFPKDIENSSMTVTLPKKSGYRASRQP